LRREYLKKPEEEIGSAMRRRATSTASSASRVPPLQQPQRHCSRSAESSDTKILIGTNVVGRYMYDVTCYSYFVARRSIGNVLDAVSREMAHTPAGFGHVIQSLLELLIGIGLAVLAVHANSKFYAYLRCGRRGDLHKSQLPALHLHCPSARERYAGD